MWRCITGAARGTRHEPRQSRPRLFVFVPWSFSQSAGIGLAWHTRWLFPLSPYLAAIPVLHYFFIAPYWAGHCFGPRYFADMMPFFFLFLVPAILDWSAIRPGAARQALAVVFVACWGVFVNFRGATSTAVHHWNAVPGSVDHAMWRVWDWNDPPFLRGLR
jgi:hypothetical protein